MFADKLRRSARVADIKAHDPGRELIAEPALRRAGELVVGRNVERRCRVLHPVEYRLVAVNRGCAVDVEEADLFGLEIGDRRRGRERIEVIVAKPPARAAFGPCLDHRTDPGIAAAVADQSRGSGHQHRIGVGVSDARIVGQRDPALDVDLADIAVGPFLEQRDVVRAPAEPRSQIAQRRLARPGGGLQCHRQCRIGAHVGRDLVEDYPHRQAVVAQHLDAVADLEDHPAVGRQHHRLLAGLGTARRVGADQRDRLADGVLHDLGGGEQVVVEILLDDVDPG